MTNDYQLGYKDGFETGKYRAGYENNAEYSKGFEHGRKALAEAMEEWRAYMAG